MSRAIALVVLCAAIAGVPSGAFAQPPSWTLQWENDFWIKGGDDDDYTNGVRLSVDFTRALWWKRWGRGYRNCNDEADPSKPCLRTTLMFGQNFYTPHDITTMQVQEGDRPYAAWLYGGFAARVARSKRLTSIELQIGATGKWAFGEEVQTAIHSLPVVRDHSPKPKGWRHQVKPVPGLVGIVASWDDKFAFERRTHTPSPYVFADAIPYYRVTVGNVRTEAVAGATLRLGYNIQRRWTEKIGPTIMVASASLARPPDERRWFLNGFVGLEGRAVGWNALLQHDTYTGQHLAPIRRGVLDIEFGIAAGYRRVSGGFRWVCRSREFDGGRISRFAGPFITWGSKVQ